MLHPHLLILTRSRFEYVICWLCICKSLCTQITFTKDIKGTLFSGLFFGPKTVFSDQCIVYYFSAENEVYKFIKLPKENKYYT